jgi:Fe-S cluster assembly ATP-binding protein
MLRRPVNVSFSGGEKKRAETRMILLEPVASDDRLRAHIDALESSQRVNQLRSKDRASL